ncbi:MAG: hypothetical protein K2J10_04175 [Muribaculaceae bacterium]|nr:hypothetical protein [Muribaculaceae bacterium]
MKKLYSLVLVVVTAALSASGAISGQKFSKRMPLNVAESPNSRVVVALEEDFSKFTEGSETSPAPEALEKDWYGSFDESKVSVKGWGGNGVHEAGGSAFIEKDGVLWTPTIDMTNSINKDIIITFRARLGENAEAGVPSVTMGYGKTNELPALAKQWQNYKIDISGAYSGADFTFGATSDWLIDDVKIEKHVAYVETPGGLSFNNYTGTGFRAIWQPVSGAHHYLVNVYSVDDALESLTPIVSGLKADDVYCDVTDLPEIDDLFCFNVTAVDANGNTSEASMPLLVEALLTPETYDATEVTSSGFNASWEAVDGAIFYDFYTYRRTEAEQDGDFAILDTDFSFITAETSSDEYSVSFDLLPGWIINVPMFEDGAIGMDGAKAPIETTLFASMESPAYNLSAGGGEVEITVSLRGTRGAKVTFSLYTMKNGSYPVFPESYVALDGLQFEEYETRTFTLTGGGENSVIYIETCDWEWAWITDLKIVQHVKAGETVSAPVINYLTLDNSAEVKDIDLTDGYKYYYIVRAVGISRDEEYYISSDFTAPHFVEYDPAGLGQISVEAEASVEVSGKTIVVSNPANRPVAVYDMTGGIIYESAGASEHEEINLNGGFYIVKVGNDSFKVSL